MFEDHTAYIHLGTNLGRRREHLRQALMNLEEFAGTISSSSSIYETAPWGNINQSNFLNIAIEFRTKLAPFELLYEIHRIEEKMGRNRTEHWGPRVIDLDILFFDSIIIDYQRLTIPHPLIKERRFVLAPLFEIAPDLVHPKSGLSIEEISAKCTDKSTVLLLSE